MVLIMLLRADFLVQIVSVLIRAKALRGPVSRSSRPQTPSSSPKETNTCDDVSVDHKNDVFKVKTAEGSEQAPSTSLTGRKRSQHKAVEGKTQVTSTSQTNRKEKQSAPNYQSDKPRNLSATSRDEEKHENRECKSSPNDGEVEKVPLFGAPIETTKDQ